MIDFIGDKYRRAFSILGLRFVLETDKKELIRDDEYFYGKGGHLHSLLSNFYKLEEINLPESPDFIFHLVDIEAPNVRFYDRGNGNFILEGPLSLSERETRDKRSSIFGNMGFFSKLLVRELEKRGIFSIHSTSFFDRTTNRLFLVMGGSGSGKSTVLLKAISMGGIEVFSTELTHFSFEENSVKMLKGSLWQNCRMGNLVVDFPDLLNKFGLDPPADDPWHSYKSVPMHQMQVPEDALDTATIIVLLPRIEGERNSSSIRQVPKASIKMTLYQNLSDKVSPPSLLWGKYFIPSLDSRELEVARMASAERFIAQALIGECWDILSSPATCLNGLYPVGSIKRSTIKTKIPGGVK
jgi:hypothetical protein